jgi:hypothetical protein
MHLTVALSVDITEGKTQTTVPKVVAPHILCPLRAGVVDMCHLPGRLEILGHIVIEPLLKLL